MLDRQKLSIVFAAMIAALLTAGAMIAGSAEAAGQASAASRLFAAVLPPA